MKRTIITSFIALAVITLGVAFVTTQDTSAAAEKPCINKGQDKTSWTVNGNVATAHFNIPKECKEVKISLSSYTSPSNTDGRPYTAQKFYASTTHVFNKPGQHKLSVKIPNCFYQVDLVRGAPIKVFTHPTDAWLANDKRLLAGKVGGSQSCDAKPAIVPATQFETTPKPPADNPEVPVVETASAKESQPEALPNTGPAGVIAAFFGTSALGSGAYYAVNYGRRYRYLLNNLF